MVVSKIAKKITGKKDLQKQITENPSQLTFTLPPSQDPVDLGEATAEATRSILNKDKIDFITEIQSLQELRLITYALIEAESYGEDFQKAYFEKYLLLKTSYQRKRTHEIITMISKAKEELLGEANRITAMLTGNRRV